MGELQHEAFQLTFNGLLKVAFQGSRVTSDAGLLLVRELDERLGLETLIAEHLSDSRHGLNRQFSLAGLLRGTPRAYPPPAAVQSPARAGRPSPQRYPVGSTSTRPELMGIGRRKNVRRRNLAVQKGMGV